MREGLRAGGQINQFVAATNPATEGDGNALGLSGLPTPEGAGGDRRGGLPSGSVLEFVNSQRPADAPEGWRAF